MQNFLRRLLRGMGRLLKWMLVASVVTGLVVGVSIGFVRYQELNFMTTHDWQFQGGWLGGPTQWRKTAPTDPGVLPSIILRRVHPEQHHQVLAFLHEDKLVAVAHWFTECSPDTEIEVSPTYSDGSPFVLTCKESNNLDATFLEVHAVFSAHAVFSNDYNRAQWEQDFDGFRVNENFSRGWDFTEARRLQALNRATKPRVDEDP